MGVFFLVLVPLVRAGVPGDTLGVISRDSLRTHVAFLASEELAGREATHAGAEGAARYIATTFEQFGLDTLAQCRGYFQEFPVTEAWVDLENTSLTLQSRGWFRKKTHLFRPDEGFFFYPRTARNFEVTAGMVFAGYGITAEEYGYDDYAGVDASGRVVVAFWGEPQEEDSTSVFEGKQCTKYSFYQTKARIARAHGAVALLIMQVPLPEKPPLAKLIGRYRSRLEKPFLILEDSPPELPVFFLNDGVTEILFRGSPRTAMDCWEEIEDRLKPVSFILAKKLLTIHTAVKDKVIKRTTNVVGLWPGSDRDPGVVIIGAHYDHIGTGRNGEIYYGADDNASGVAGLLELARVFSLSPQKPKRDLMFIAFGAEEEGMLGSQCYVHHPLVPLDQTVAMLNMDCIGRNGADSFRGIHNPNLEEEGKDRLMVFYSAQAPDLEMINVQANAGIDLTLDVDPNVTFTSSSDHAVFHRARIPVTFYFSGFHPDYHQPTDTIDKINFHKMERIVQLIYKTAWNIADREEKLIFDTSIKTVKKKKKYVF